MNILVCNDDGIDFEGLQVLAKTLSSIGNVYIAAPDSERSSNSHHLTIKGRVRFEERHYPYAKKAYALWGTPADCVHMGMYFLFDEKIDLVVSGINKGANVSTDIIYSGTIGAAREAFLYHVPSIAVSIDSFKAEDYSVAAGYAREVALRYMEDENRCDYFLNLNVPYLKKEEIKGIRICDRICRVVYHDVYSYERKDEKDFILIGNGNFTYEGGEDDLRVDVTALANGYVSLSALGNDHIDADHNESVERIIEKCR
ncbi:MAG: 5'/3'-nucleotidase SurE [Erysipelotrichaceae bacterium]|nr:5'/3'-nucleotidase SurE [Erysipelotrichaceae bacterium]